MNAPPACILIVDDEAKNRKLLALLLHSEGYLTSSVASAEEAMAAIALSAPDLILLDVMMPGMNGYQFAAMLKADPATLGIPIIMLTAQIDHGARMSGLKAGVEEFLTKPFDSVDLSLRVRNLLRLKAFSDFQKNHAAILEHEVQVRSAELHRFRAAMDATADAITLVDRATMRFVEVNATACKMMGLSRAEMLQMGPAQLLTGPADAHALEQDYDAVIAGATGRDATEVLLKRPDGSSLWVETHRHAERSGVDWIVVSVLRDITERKAAEKRLLQVAHYDRLTGLPNRILFFETLERTLIKAAARNWSVALLVIDLDHFKNVNDTRGHALGDELLCQVSSRLIQCVRIRDTVARIGGDEFGVLLVPRDAPQRAIAVGNRIREVLRPPFVVKDAEVTVTASVGVAIYPDDASNGETLVQYADTAMHQAKSAGRDTRRFFKAQMNTDALARLNLETALRKAIENDEFLLHYQPKMHIASGRICGLEALLRWQRPGIGLVSPGEFIPVLEDSGLIVPVGRWVLDATCKQINAWSASSIGPMGVSVNVASRQFTEGDLELDVTEALARHHVAAHLLELELTESSLITNTEDTVKTLQKLKSAGVSISIDDFGTGYSSLAYLRRFSVDKLKIDMAFIRGITSNADDAAIALAIIRMAHTLKLEVVAEGVETEAQFAFLRAHHCDQIQGFYFSRPLAGAELDARLHLESQEEFRAPSCAAGGR